MCHTYYLIKSSATSQVCYVGLRVGHVAPQDADVSRVAVDRRLQLRGPLGEVVVGRVHLVKQRVDPRRLPAELPLGGVSAPGVGKLERDDKPSM